MRNYLVFAGTKYYPEGGMKDFRCDFDTLAEATAWCKGYCESACLTWAHVSNAEGEVLFQTTSDD